MDNLNRIIEKETNFVWLFWITFINTTDAARDKSSMMCPATTKNLSFAKTKTGQRKFILSIYWHILTVMQKYKKSFKPKKGWLMDGRKIQHESHDDDDDDEW